MKVKIPVKGLICESLQGRDKGCLYCIVNVLDDAYVTVADGKYKTLASPKRKNVKHLCLSNESLESYGVNLSNACDSQIAYALKQFLLHKAQKPN
jgi:ribosomal protein L14E/L6E/L27E